MDHRLVFALFRNGGDQPKFVGNICTKDLKTHSRLENSQTHDGPLQFHGQTTRK